MLVKGSVVKSVSGRDKNRFYVVLDFFDNYLCIADGKMRKLNFPKKKSIKHVILTNNVLDLSGITSDKKLRKLLFEYNNAVSSEGGNLDG